MKRLKNQSGFTLAETLLAVLILLLVSTIVATGAPAARNAYEKVVIGANAQTMLSTAVTALRDELGTAWQVKASGDKSIEYFNASTGAYSKIYLESGNDTPVMLQDYVKLDAVTSLIHSEGAEQGKARRLVPDTNTGLYVTYDSIAIDEANAVVTFIGLKVCLKSDKTELTSLDSLKIRLLSGDFA